MHFLSSKINLSTSSKYLFPFFIISYFVIIGSENIPLNDTFLISFYGSHKLTENFFLGTTFAPLGYLSYYLSYLIFIIRPENFFLDIYQLYILFSLLFFYFYFLFFINLNKKENIFFLVLFLICFYSEKSYPFYTSTALIFYSILIINFLPIQNFFKKKIENKSVITIFFLLIFFSRQDFALLGLFIFSIYGYFYDKKIFITSIISSLCLCVLIAVLLYNSNSYNYINLFFNAQVNRYDTTEILLEIKNLIISIHFLMIVFLIIKNIFFNFKSKRIDLYFFLVNFSFLIIDFQTGTREILFVSGVFNSLYFLRYKLKIIFIFLIIIINNQLFQQLLNHTALNIFKNDSPVLIDNIPKFKTNNDYKDIIYEIMNLYEDNLKIINISETRFLDSYYKNYNNVFLPIWIDDNVTFYDKDVVTVFNSIINFDPEIIIIQDTNNSKINECYFELNMINNHNCLTSNYFNLINLFTNEYDLSITYSMELNNNIYILNKKNDLF